MESQASDLDVIRECLRRPPAWGPNEHGDLMVDMTVESYERDLDHLVEAAKKTRAGRVEVDPHVVLYAFRYGVGRATYAHGDALDLVWRHWSVLKQWADTIRADLVDVLNNPHPMSTDDEKQRCKELIEWMDVQ